ncbi:hypothetical protein [Massilia sp. H6]|uniref:hypothetical protein n=1 Tax=Massilia sp. H6 TaxID=2970464 RepID=UPI00216778D1|nr:hypothetical protein [Massilia sp. H6]UVW27123.1 hypothetical protein NRS07_11145 [Massilia sp. H6]
MPSQIIAAMMLCDAGTIAERSWSAPPGCRHLPAGQVAGYRNTQPMGRTVGQACQGAGIAPDAIAIGNRDF